MYTIVIETPTLLNRTFLWISGKVSNRISTELYRFCKRMGISRSCSDIRQKAKLRHVIESKMSPFLLSGSRFGVNQAIRR